MLQFYSLVRSGDCKLPGEKRETEDEEFTFWCYPKLHCIPSWFLFLQMLVICALCFPSDLLLTLQPAQIMTFKVKEMSGMCFNVVQVLVKGGLTACFQVFFHKHGSQRLRKIIFPIPLFIECIAFSFFLLIPAF